MPRAIRASPAATLVAPLCLASFFGHHSSAAASSPAWSNPAPLRVGPAVLDVKYCAGSVQEMGNIPGLKPRGIWEDEGDCVDGVWGEWGAWQGCSNSCGGGFEVRHRREERAASRCGKPLVGSEHDFRKCGDFYSNPAGGDAATSPSAFLASRTAAGSSSCSPQETQQVCTLSDWSPWTGCGAACGDNQRMRQRYLIMSTRSAVLEEQVDDLKRNVHTLQDALTRTSGSLASKMMAKLEAQEQQQSDQADRSFQNLQRQADLLKAKNVGLETANLALESEAKDLKETADRLRLALPLVFGVMSIVAVAAAVLVSNWFFQNQRLQGRDTTTGSQPFMDLENPRISVRGAAAATNVGVAATVSSREETAEALLAQQRQHLLSIETPAAAGEEEESPGRQQHLLNLRGLWSPTKGMHLQLPPGHGDAPGSRSPASRGTLLSPMARGRGAAGGADAFGFESPKGGSRPSRERSEPI